MSALVPFVGGLLGLVVGGHLVVASSSRLGSRFGLSPMAVGLTIVAVGTSAPELAVVSQSVHAGDSALAVGSIIGSNIANILLVLGLVAATGGIVVTSTVVRKDIPVMIAASVALFVLGYDQKLSRVDGAVFVLAVGAFMWWTLRVSRVAATEQATATQPQWRRSTVLLAIVAGIGALAVSARFVVAGAEQIALSLGVPELLVGLTVVAIGTSAPEIVTTIVAAMKGQRDLAVGNAVGSNIFNILLVLGSVSLFSSSGVSIGIDALQLDVPIMVAAAVACLPMVLWDHRLDRWEGALFVAYYVAYIGFLGLDGAGHQATELLGVALVGFVLPLTLVTVVTIGVHSRRDTFEHRATPVLHHEELAEVSVERKNTSGERR